MRKLPIILFQILVFAKMIHSFPGADGKWVTIEIGSILPADGITTWINEIIIGKGRNNGLNYVYVMSDNANVLELQFADSIWNVNLVGSVEKWGEAITMGAFKGDNKNRIYASSRSDFFYEFTFNEIDWSRTTVGVGGGRSLVTGEGKNNNINNLYGDGFGSSKEISWIDNSWIITEIDFNNNVQHLVVGDARNDGLNRVYSVGQKFTEIQYSDSVWESKVLDSSRSGLIREIVIGDGRNDNINRVYYSDGALYEYSYINNEWVIDSLGGSSTKNIIIADGRNEGINNIYVTYGGDSLTEFAYRMGSWNSTDELVGWRGLAIGDGRNDGKNRVYSADYDGKIYESIFEFKSYEIEKLDVTCITTPCYNYKLINLTEAETTLVAAILDTTNQFFPDYSINKDLKVNGFFKNDSLSSWVDSGTIFTFTKIVNDSSTTRTIHTNNSDEKFSLKVFPNPFNSSTTIAFPNPLHSATVTIFNIKGKFVKSFKNLTTNSVTWNASGLPNGIYHVRITSGRKTYTRQINLFK